MTADEDDRLAARAARGDAPAFTQLVRRHEGRVRAFLHRLCRRTDLADDLAQETFLQAWRKAGAYRGEGRYRAWLLGIAWRRFLSQARKTGREADQDEAALAQATAVSDPAAGLDIEAALARLSPIERGAALLCFAEGCSHAEAALVLNVPLGTLKSAAARARARLTAQLKESGA